MSSARRLSPFLLTALVALPGCGRADSAPAVATVSVAVNKTAVALGSPVDLTYRFEVAPDARIDGDYRVFVHVNRDDGTTIWNDDHDLPAGSQTSTWKPGQVIQYTRTRFIPAFSYLGEATVQIGLYREDQRLPLAGPDPADRELPARAYKVATLTLLPRSENIQVIRMSGWHPGEFAQDDATVEWQWTQKLATLSLRNPRRDVVLFLEFDSRPDFFADGPQQVTVYAGATTVQTFAADRSSAFLHRIPISADQLGSGEMAELRIEVDRTFVPAKVAAGSRDGRELGIRVYHVYVSPR